MHVDSANAELVEAAGLELVLPHAAIATVQVSVATLTDALADRLAVSRLT